ncbi:MAG: Asp23/Gls24 family envelope stress response protein [Lachnospiraceae bacterium]|nr:Asp23/Gls24 family envelope stress response protein [Lachnospiraceae bacterium]
MEQHKENFAVENARQEDGQGIGTIRIADDVVAMIASIATLDVEGVSSMAGDSASDIMNKVGVKKSPRGVKVEIKDNIVRISLAVILKYGYNIPATSSSIQSKVKTSIENMTGLYCSDVNVRISGIEIV